MSLIDDLKEISIIEWLATKGYPVVKETGNKAFICSPFRNEQNPSFVVFKNNNTWIDFGRSTRTASIIDLVQELNNCDTLEAMSLLRNEDDTCRFEPTPMSNEPLISVIKTLDRYISPDLLMYLKSRGIGENVYNKYTKETYYAFKDTPDKKYHAVGLINNSGGFELRNSYHKYCVSPKDATTYLVGSPHCSLFEGIFDFLSAVEYFGDSLFESDVYILNGLGILHRYIDQVCRYKKVNIFLDLGVGASNSIDFIRSRMYDGVVVDHRGIFGESKDFNEFWCNLNKK